MRIGLAIIVALLIFVVNTAAVPAQGDDIKTLGKTRVEWLQILREHKDLRYRRASLLALEAIGPQRPVLAGLYEALEKDPEPQVRREVTQLLGRFGPEAKGAGAAVAAALRSDAAGPVREAAATALGGKLLDEAQSYVPVLAAALKDSYPGVRAAAAEALKNLGEAARPAFPALASVARERKEERHTRIFALQTLARWGKDDPSLPGLFVAVLSDRDAPPGVRVGAAEGLARLGSASPAAVAALGEALSAKASEVRLAAAVALTTLGPAAGAAWPALKANLGDADVGLRYQLIRAAGMLAKDQPETIAALAERARSDDAIENRLAALQELGEAGPAARSAQALLEQLASQDARARVREAAAAALRKVK